MVPPFALADEMIAIINDDNLPNIKEIICFPYGGGIIPDEFSDPRKRRPGIGILFNIRNCSLELRTQLEEVSGCMVSEGNNEGDDSVMLSFSYPYVEKLEDIISIFKLIQEVDPLPQDAFIEMKELYDLSFGMFTNNAIIEKKVLDGRLEEALKLAKEAGSLGDDGPLLTLVHFYKLRLLSSGNDCYREFSSSQENQCSAAAANGSLDDDFQPMESKEFFECLTHVLMHVSKSNPLYVKFNEELHELLLIKGASSEQDQYRVLEQKFQSALNSNQVILASRYFDELCGNSGMEPAIMDIKGDANTLIQLGRTIRELQKQNSELKILSTNVENQPTAKGPGFF